MKYKYDEDRDILILKFNQGEYTPENVKEYEFADGNVKIRYLDEQKPLSIVILNFHETINRPDMKEVIGGMSGILPQVKTLFGIGGVNR